MRPELRRRAGDLRRRARGSAGAGPTAGDVRLIVDSGLLDRAWVGLQTGGSLDSDEDAARAVLAARHDVSVHPLVELAVGDGVTAPGGPDGPVGLLDYLRDPALRDTVPTHPLLDPARLRREARGLEPQPGGPLAAWLAAAGPQTPLPSPAGFAPVTLGEVRTHAVAALREHQRLRRVAAAARGVGTLPAAGPVSPPAPPAGRSGAPLVSVVVATWDRGPLLRRCLDSVIAQTCADWELVVVDDGSGDDTAGVLAGLARFEPRLVSVAVPHGGVGRARNVAVDRARGTYLAFLDTERAWEPDFLATMLARVVADDLVLAHAAVRARSEGSVVLSAFAGTRGHLLAAGLAGSHVDLDALVVRRDAVLAVGGFAEDLDRFVDQDLLLRLAAEHPLTLVPYVAVEPETEDPDPRARQGAADVRASVAPRIADTASPSWRSVVLERALVDWSAAPPTVPGRTSLVLAAEDDPGSAVRWLTAFLRSGAGAGAGDEANGEAGAGAEGRAGAGPAHELLVVAGTGAPRDRGLHVVAGTLARLGGSTRLVVLPGGAPAGVALNLGAALGTGDRVVLARAAVDADPAALLALAAGLDDPTVTLAQPAYLSGDGVVAGAGAVFGPGSVRPEVFLEHHPARDLDALGGPLNLPSALGPVVALRAADVRRLRGVDPLLGDSLPEVELGLRVRREGGRVVLDPGVRLRATGPELAGPARLRAAVELLERRAASPAAGSEAAWAAAGFEVLGHRNHPVRPHSAGRFRPGAGEDVLLVPRAVVRPVVPRAERLLEHPPALRWTIDTAAPAGPRGLAWGDTHFAGALRDALERRGQRVAVDPRQARHRPTRDFDDVVLVLRGLDRVRPRPGTLTVEWVISHPDLLDAAELGAVDLAYAASTSWAARRTADWGVPVRPLLQCTDPSLFHPGRGGEAERDGGPAVLFVGNSRGVYRSSLRAALAAGADVEIHGSGWSDFLPKRRLASERLDNAELGRLYARAGVVLNDHHEDMRRDGFMSNRLFDAGACGARIVSDEVAGAAEIFGPLLRTFRADADMPALLRDPEALFGTREERLARAAVIAAEHSFDRRAETLVDDVAALLASR